MFRKSNTLAVHLAKAKQATNLKEINLIKTLLLKQIEARINGRINYVNGWECLTSHRWKLAPN